MKIEAAESGAVDSREREVQLIMNIVEPDPEYQAIFISDNACFYDITGQDAKEIEAKLKFYFKGELPAPLSTPIWKFIDIVKQRYPGWPEEWPREH